MSVLKYEYSRIEKKWQEKWRQAQAFRCENASGKPKFFGLVEFPYPSGHGLHVGHARPYTAMDVVVRKKRMDGYNVMFPWGGTPSDFRPKITPSPTISILPR